MTGPRLRPAGKPLTAEVLERARHMMEAKESWARIESKTGVSAHRIRMVIEPGYAERYRSKDRDRQRASFRPIGVREPVEPMVHRNPLYDPRRDGPLPEYETITAAWNGDPRPGRSALDQRKG